MLHVTCDLCGKELRAGEDDHFVVKVEVFPLHNPAELTEEDLDEDHLEAVGEMLREMEENPGEDGLEKVNHHFRYDLCGGCRKKFVRDPLAKETAQKFDFSEN